MNRAHYVQYLAIVVIIGLVGFQAVTVATSGELGEYVQESEAWCDQRGGELVNSRAFFHGGLHCYLPNGTSVHMSEVVGESG